MLRAAGSDGERRLVADVVADHRMLLAARDRYDTRPASQADGVGQLLRDLVAHVGLQQLAVFRCATALHRRGWTPVAMVLCRLIRVVYGAEMHWETDVAPGVMLVHGNGIVISRDAHIGAGCVIAQHVTIGISRSAQGEVGAPTLLENVHVGPGAAILGPVTIGADSKIGPNAVVDTTVPTRTLVTAPEAVERPRPSVSKPVEP